MLYWDNQRYQYVIGVNIFYELDVKMSYYFIECLIYMEQIEEWFFRICKKHLKKISKLWNEIEKIWKTILTNSLKISIHASLT